MSCYHPIRVPIVRKSSVAELKDMVEVPCGNCLGCRGDQSRQWAVRMMHESTMHEISWFCTLTYSDEELPENGSLYPEDFSRFIKDLRKRYPPGKISYYGCGEYGDISDRPHLHIVLFGPDFLDRYQYTDSGRDNCWRSESLEDTWGHGIAELGTLTMASASYVAGYVRKKVAAQQNPDHYVRVHEDTGELVNVQPEFSRMSLRPAIGKRWIEKWWRDVYPRDYVVVEGKEAKPPRYYDKWMDHHQPHIMAAVRDTRWAELKQLDQSKLDMKEAIHRSRNSLFAGRTRI